MSHSYHHKSSIIVHILGFPGGSVQLLSCVRLFATLWIATRQDPLSITNSRNSPKLMSIMLVMPSIHLILRRPLLLRPPIPPSIRVFSNESTLPRRWPKYWSNGLGDCNWHMCNTRYIKLTRNFPGGPVVKTPCFQCRRWGFNTWSRN